MNDAAPQKLTFNSNPITLIETKQRIDDFLQLHYEKKQINAATIDPSYGELWQAIIDLASAGGKRLRPYITLLSYMACNPEGNSNDILPAAASQELIHLAMLIHDDIIDRDDTRYGVKNISGQYKSRYQIDVPDETLRAHFATSAAILAGDSLLSESYRLLTTCSVDARLILKAHDVLGSAIFSVIGGEFLDTESSIRRNASSTALTIATYKTASYSFVGPLVMGATLAGASEATLEAFTRFGTALGIAYQLRDDLLGIFGDESITGKSTSGDIREGKRTFLIETFEDCASVSQKQQFHNLFGTDASDEEFGIVRELLVTSGAVDLVEKTIDNYSAEALGHLDVLSNGNAQTRQQLESLVVLCTQRDR